MFSFKRERLILVANSFRVSDCLRHGARLVCVCLIIIMRSAFYPNLALYKTGSCLFIYLLTTAVQHTVIKHCLLSLFLL